MEKECNNCLDDNIGCNVIREMKKNINALKRKRCLWDIAMSVVGIVWVVILGVFVYRTFCPVPQTEKRIYNLIINNKDAMSEKAKAEIQTHLAEALTNVEERASRAYNEKFAAILAVLSVFGVAWPVIVGFLQFKFNEKELNKIETTSNQAKTASEQATNALVQISQVKGEAEEATKKAEDSLQTATSAVKNAQDSIKVLLIQYQVFSRIYYDMGLDKRQTNPGSFGIFNHYFALSLEFKLRSFMLDERNIAENSITRILSEFDFSQPNSDKNIKSRNTLTTCKALAGEIRRNAIGTVREKEAEKVWLAVVTKYNQFGGSPIDGEDD